MRAVPLILVLVLSGTVPPADAHAQAQAQAQQPRWTIEFNPVTDVYSRYIADPRRARNIIAVLHAIDSSIPDTGELRYHLATGGQYSFLRLHQGDPQLGWQLDVDARFYAQFDIDHGLDEIGHDGRLGMIVSKGFSDRAAARFAFHHTSSHLGDEYLIRNEGFERLSVRKEEFALGWSWRHSPHVRLYGETGYGIHLGELNEPWRLQGGVELTSAKRPFEWYAALDLTSFQENDWNLSSNLQTGIALPTRGGRAYRFGLELYRGRAQLDSFFLFRESYVVVGAWLDL